MVVALLGVNKNTLAGPEARGGFASRIQAPRAVAGIFYRDIKLIELSQREISEGRRDASRSENLKLILRSYNKSDCIYSADGLGV